METNQYSQHRSYLIQRPSSTYSGSTGRSTIAIATLIHTHTHTHTHTHYLLTTETETAVKKD